MDLLLVLARFALLLLRVALFFSCGFASFDESVGVAGWFISSFVGSIVKGGDTSFCIWLSVTGCCAASTNNGDAVSAFGSVEGLSCVSSGGGVVGSLGVIASLSWGSSIGFGVGYCCISSLRPTLFKFLKALFHSLL